MTKHSSPPAFDENAAKLASTRAMIYHTESRVRTTLEWMVEATATQQPNTAGNLKAIAKIANASRHAVAAAHGELAHAEDARDRDQVELEAHLEAAAEKANEAWALSDLAADKIDQLQYAASVARALEPQARADPLRSGSLSSRFAPGSLS